jgi:5-methylcytosine-specific restriction protein A
VEPELCADPKFRSPQAIAYKLHNFVGIDPASTVAGFPHSGRGDKLVWEEFAGDQGRLTATAAAIRSNLNVVSQRDAEGSENDISEAEEGKVLTGVHRRRERDSKLRKAKVKRVLSETGRLACEACDLDFGERYGERGSGFIECHHIRPLHTLKPRQKTKLSDLALLCSNCHRMVHVRRPWLTLDQLRQIQNP